MAMQTDISIHAPLTGCDIPQEYLHHVYIEFQSTHPLRDATCLTDDEDKYQIISIHAPLTGCDQLVP